jgi:1-acyl-sn-glycerol-3-phosphate acyltransferase
MFETFFLQTIFDAPVFILKKELLMIPIFGWYLKKIGSISIKRNKISKENLGFFERYYKTNKLIRQTFDNFSTRDKVSS